MEDKVVLKIKVVIFSVINGTLKILLEGSILPARILGKGQSVDEVAKEILTSLLEVKMSDFYLEQLYTFSSSADKGSEIAVVYYILLREEDVRKTKIKTWDEYDKVSKQLKDYQIVNYAVQRLRWKMEYTNVVYSLLPEKFTLSELQQTYEVILGRSLDKRNFRKKILSLGLLKSSHKKKLVGRARPAKMYEFKSRELTYVEILKSSN